MFLRNRLFTPMGHSNVSSSNRLSKQFSTKSKKIEQTKDENKLMTLSVPNIAKNSTELNKAAIDKVLTDVAKATLKEDKKVSSSDGALKNFEITLLKRHYTFEKMCQLYRYEIKLYDEVFNSLSLIVQQSFVPGEMYFDLEKSKSLSIGEKEYINSILSEIGHPNTLSSEGGCIPVEEFLRLSIKSQRVIYALFYEDNCFSIKDFQSFTEEQQDELIHMYLEFDSKINVETPAEKFIDRITKKAFEFKRQSAMRPIYVANNPFGK